MSDFKDRLLTEKSELDEKIQKLQAFLASENVTKISGEQHGMLIQQLKPMELYSKILGERIENLNL